MLRNCVLCVAALASLSLQYASARPTSDHRKSPSNTEQPGLTLDDPAGLQNLLDMCRLNPEMCRKGGRVEGVTERLLHRLGLTRVQSHVMLQVLRACLEDIDDCDTAATVSAMINVQQLSASYRRNGGKAKRGKSLRLVMPTIRHHLNVGKEIGFDTLYMYSRHGRNGGLSEEKTRRSATHLLRSKRNIPSFFNNIIRVTCSGKKCSTGENDEEEDDRHLPGNSFA